MEYSKGAYPTQPPPAKGGPYSYPPPPPYQGGPGGPGPHYIVINQPTGTMPVTERGPKPPDRMLLSLCLCTCCNWMGIAAVVLNMMAHRAWQRGDQGDAEDMSRWTYYINIFVFVTGLLFVWLPSAIWGAFLVSAMVQYRFDANGTVITNNDTTAILLG